MPSNLIDSPIGQDLQRLATDLDRRVVAKQEKDVVVTFLGANADLDVPHTFVGVNPDNIRYTVVRKDRACDIYDNQTAVPRRAWTADYIVLRSTVANATVTLRLSV